MPGIWLTKFSTRWRVIEVRLTDAASGNWISTKTSALVLLGQEAGGRDLEQAVSARGEDADQDQRENRDAHQPPHDGGIGIAAVVDPAHDIAHDAAPPAMAPAAA